MSRRPAAIKNTTLSLIDQVCRRSRLLAKPLKIHLEINDICNLKCIHCPRELPGLRVQTGHMDMAVIEAIRPYFKNATYVGLIGNGEPFTHPHLFEIVEMITEVGAIPSIISNATLWNEEKLDRLIRAGRSLMTVSFDGGTKETFERIRTPAKYEKVVANMKLLGERKRALGSEYPVTNIISVLMRDTLAEATDLVELAAEVGIGRVTFQVMQPYSPDMESNLLTADDRDEVVETIDRARKRANELGIEIDFHSQWDETRGEVNGKAMHCPNIWEQMHIDMHGNLRFCCYWEQEDLGNITEASPGVLWNDPRYIDLRNRFKSGDVPKLCTEMPCPNLKPHSPRALVREAKANIREAWRS